jgi:RNA recognition motif-containing protein
VYEGKLERSNTTIIVKNIPFSTQTFELKNLFAPFGEIEKVIR